MIRRKVSISLDLKTHPEVSLNFYLKGPFRGSVRGTIGPLAVDDQVGISRSYQIEPHSNVFEIQCYQELGKLTLLIVARPIMPISRRPTSLSDMNLLAILDCHAKQPGL